MLCCQINVKIANTTGRGCQAGFYLKSEDKIAQKCSKILLMCKSIFSWIFLRHYNFVKTLKTWQEAMNQAWQIMLERFYCPKIKAGRDLLTAFEINSWLSDISNLPVCTKGFLYKNNWNGNTQRQCLKRKFTDWMTNFPTKVPNVWLFEKGLQIKSGVN